MTVSEYRKKHKRCTTCVYSEDRCVGWFCKAKQKKYFDGLYYTRIKGMFCRLYKPMKETSFEE